MGCFNFKKSSKTKSNKTVPSKKSSSIPSQSKTSTEKSKVSSSSVKLDQPITKNATSTPPRCSIPNLYEQRGQKLRVFDFEELRAATNDFNRALKLGEGGFGTVFKGFLKGRDSNGERLVVAVKRLKQRSLQGHKQWLAEVLFLGVVEHPNLVKLIGYCAVDGEEGNQRLLVYEFMPNKTLDDHLFSRAYPPLSWDLRLQIILGAVEGLVYLHEGLEVQIIFRDFKASNVLLDKEFKPKLSDFGLAREGPTASKTHVSTAVVGTHGYAAPDYIQTGHLTAKSDVWSFGVVLYELLTGRRSLERNRPPAERKLLNWVKQYPPEATNFSVIMDPRLRNQYPPKAAREVARLADRCLVKDPKKRPSMAEVSQVLKEIMRIKR
ncbi:Protein kinase superfamily protein [Rhynchospora pubera]|uniref:Protein kinase superfamily protein n=1 Tax=Rhynchospora pubera TaxID=906938 RepID=A0AAV8GKZ4_9POAL|nr:Protein kinase superfamily protein [Rhynchospora pubera]KAJ4806323.1 Protein kinase superfamily protein [Rhynchospora pubera]